MTVSQTPSSDFGQASSPTHADDFLSHAHGKVSPLVHWQMRLIRRSLAPGPVDRARAWCQRTLGQRWIRWATGNLHEVHGLERLDSLASSRRSFILVANHRSFFDLYVVTATLVAKGFQQRIVFPVRSTFFYDTLPGLLVNAGMSFLAMYPPLFRDRRLTALNLLGLEELVRLLSEQPTLVGIHPEGTRNRDPDPYKLLPPQRGVGLIIHKARVPVVPVFTNGLRTDGLAGQIRGNFDGTGAAIHTVFGAPIEFGALLDEPGTPVTYRKLAERCHEALAALGEEERRIRSQSSS